MDAEDLTRHLRSVLDGQPFPAQRWQLIATAEYYGADRATIVCLHQLRASQYPRLADVVVEILQTGAVRERMSGGPR